MKLISAIVLTVGLQLALPAADIICTSYPVWLLTRALTQDVPGIKLQLIQRSGSGCSHEYTPSPQDMRKVTPRGAILIGCGKTDAHILQAALKVNDSLQVISADARINAPDDHTFASPHTARQMCITIAGELGKIDPANQTLYQKNLHNFCTRLDKLIIKAQNLSGQGDYVVLQSAVFINLAVLTQRKFILLKHEKSDSMRPGAMIKVLKSARCHHAVMIWAEPHSHDSTVKVFSRESRLKSVELDPLLSGPENPPPDYYIKVMDRNLDAIERSARR